jgi:hypothetical protein
MLARDVERALPLLATDGAEPAPEAAEPALDPALAAPTESARLRVRLRGPKAVAAVAAVGLVLAGALIVGMRLSAPTTPAAPPTVVATAPTTPPPPVAAVPPAIHEPPAPPPPEDPTPAPAHPIATSSGRARPPGAKTARPTTPTSPAISSEELLRRAQEKFDVGDTQAALALARQAAAAGARAAAHILMGKVMMSERRFDEAEREFAEAVRLDPNDAKAAHLLSLVRETRSAGP